MTGKLITLPIRVGLQSARLLTRAAGCAAGRAASLAGQTIAAVTPDLRRDEPVREEPVRDEPVREEPVRHEPVREGPGERRDTSEPPQPDLATPAPARPAPARPAPVAPAPTDPLAEEPAHVSEEPELVRESAEPGAEDGAGADITVMEPWSGYRNMSAREVIARVSQGSRAELAAVRLYESRHRSRETVLAAVDRQLKLGNGADSA